MATEPDVLLHLYSALKFSREEDLYRSSLQKDYTVTAYSLLFRWMVRVLRISSRPVAPLLLAQFCKLRNCANTVPLFQRWSREVIFYRRALCPLTLRAQIGQGLFLKFTKWPKFKAVARIWQLLLAFCTWLNPNNSTSFLCSMYSEPQFCVGTCMCVRKCVPTVKTLRLEKRKLRRLISL
jgi:hypothetical protein